MSDESGTWIGAKPPVSAPTAAQPPSPPEALQLAKAFERGERRGYIVALDYESQRTLARLLRESAALREELEQIAAQNERLHGEAIHHGAALDLHEQAERRLREERDALAAAASEAENHITCFESRGGAKHRMEVLRGLRAALARCAR